MTRTSGIVRYKGFIDVGPQPNEGDVARARATLHQRVIEYLENSPSSAARPLIITLGGVAHCFLFTTKDDGVVDVIVLPRRFCEDLAGDEEFMSRISADWSVQ